MTQVLYAQNFNNYEGFVHACQIWCNFCILANNKWQESYYHYWQCNFTANITFKLSDMR